MPLASLFNLQWYGPASGAMVVATTPDVQLGIKAFKRMATTISIAVSVYLKATRLRNRPLYVQGEGIAVQLLPRKRGRMALAVTIGAQPSAFDITQSVLNSLAADYNIPNTIGAKINASGNAGDPWATEIEPTFTAAEILKLMAAVLAGKSTVNGNTIRYRDLNDTKDRIDATVVNSERTAVVKDPS
jgi:hypothetical protein